MVNKTLPYEKRAKNKTDYTISIFLIDSNTQFFMKGAWCAWCKSLVLMMFSGWVRKKMYFPCLFSCLSIMMLRGSFINTKMFSMFFFCSLKTNTLKKSQRAVSYNIYQQRKTYNVAFKQNWRKQKAVNMFQVWFTVAPSWRPNK